MDGAREGQPGREAGAGDAPRAGETSAAERAESSGEREQEIGDGVSQIYQKGETPDLLHRYCQ